VLRQLEVDLAVKRHVTCCRSVASTSAEGDAISTICVEEADMDSNLDSSNAEDDPDARGHGERRRVGKKNEQSRLYSVRQLH